MMCLLVDTCGCMEVNALCLSRLRHFYLMQWQVVWNIKQMDILSTLKLN